MDNGINKKNWKEIDLNVDSLWLINERDKTGKHSNVYHGNFVPQIPYQLLKRYTQENDLVLELFSGSGTTLFECEKLKRDYIGFDINDDIINYVIDKMTETDINFYINNCDVSDTIKFNVCVKNDLQLMNRKNVDFIIAHPPYLDIVKFTDKDEDFSKITDAKTFTKKMVSTFNNALKY